MFQRVSSTLAEIRSKLLNNTNIRKLLYNDSNNALNMDIPSIDNVEKYITLYPIYDFEHKQDYEQNSMINIVLDNADVEDNELGGILRINIATNIDKWDLVGNKIRPLELANEIYKTLYGVKFSISNLLDFNTIQELIINKSLVGYALLYDFVDGNGTINNF